jgi:hypothetical protein
MFTRCQTTYYQEVFKYRSQGKWDLEDHKSDGLNSLCNLGTGLMGLNLTWKKKIKRDCLIIQKQGKLIYQD